MGKAGSGKTTAANFLGRTYGYRVEHFATSLKAAAQEIWGTEVHHDRAKLQYLGNAVRAEYPTAWIDSCIARVDLSIEGLQRVTIDDCRFPNEVQPLKDRGFVFVRIIADEDIRVDRLQRINKFGTREQLSDITETSLDDFTPDYTITNEGLDVQFLTQVDNVVQKLRRRT